MREEQDHRAVVACKQAEIEHLRMLLAAAADELDAGLRVSARWLKVRNELRREIGKERSWPVSKRSAGGIP